MNITNNGKKYIGFLLCGSVQARVENIKLYVKSRWLKLLSKVLKGDRIHTILRSITTFRFDGRNAKGWIPDHYTMQFRVISMQAPKIPS